MSILRKYLDIVNETTVAGSVASVPAAFETTQKRVEETSTPDQPKILEYGNWENSALATTSDVKKKRSKASKVVKSIYGEDTTSEESATKPQAEKKKKGVVENKITQGSTVTPDRRSNDYLDWVSRRKAIQDLQMQGGKSDREIIMRLRAKLDKEAKEKGFALEEEGLEEMDNRTPSGDRREQRNYSPEEIANREKEQQERLKSLSPEMRKKLRLPEPKEGLGEGLNPENRAKLDDLIDQYKTATDPEYDPYSVDDHYDSDDIIAQIRSEFGDKIADQVEAGTDKMHFPRPGHTDWKADPLGWKKPVDRQTKAGKMYKQDSDFIKNTIKSRYKLSGKSATEGVDEGRFVKGPGGVPLDRQGNPKLPKPAAVKPETKPKLTLDMVWRKVEDVVGRIYPDGDPIDYMAPWLERHGIKDFKIGEVLDRAAKKHGYKDMYEYWDSMGELTEGDYPDGSSIKTPSADEWKQQYQQAVMAVKSAKTQQEYEAASDRAGSIKDLLASKGIQVGPVLGEQGVAEGLSSEIDPQATSSYAQKILDALGKYHGRSYFDYNYNKDNSITIWTKSNNINPDSVITPYYNLFRKNDWRFDQPVGGKFTIAVTKKQGVAEGSYENAAPQNLEQAFRDLDEIRDRQGEWRGVDYFKALDPEIQQQMIDWSMGKTRWNFSGHPEDNLTGQEAIQQDVHPEAQWAEFVLDISKTMKNQGVAEGLGSNNLQEQDLILNPASIGKRSFGLIGKQADRTDHEVEMAKSDLFQAGKNAAAVFKMIKDISEDEGLEGWVQEKITKAADYLNTVREYIEGKQVGEQKMFWDADRPAQPWATIEKIHGFKGESMDGVSPNTKMFTSEASLSPDDLEDLRDIRKAERGLSRPSNTGIEFNINPDAAPPARPDQYRVKVKLNSGETKTVRVKAYGEKQAKHRGADFYKVDISNVISVKKIIAGNVDESKRGLWSNIHDKRERIAKGSGEHMRKPGSKGAPTAKAFKDSK